MPLTIRSCTEGGKPGYQAGPEGKCFTFPKGDIAAEKEAHEKAVAQGQAINKSKGNW
jgi:hypothetical protein